MSSDFLPVHRFPPNSEVYVSIRTVLVVSLLFVRLTSVDNPSIEGAYLRLHSRATTLLFDPTVSHTSLSKLWDRNKNGVNCMGRS